MPRECRFSCPYLLAREPARGASKVGRSHPGSLRKPGKRNEVRCQFESRAQAHRLTLLGQRFLNP